MGSAKKIAKKNLKERRKPGSKSRAEREYVVPVLIVVGMQMMLGAFKKGG